MQQKVSQDRQKSSAGVWDTFSRLPAYQQRALTNLLDTIRKASHGCCLCSPTLLALQLSRNRRLKFKDSLRGLACFSRATATKLGLFIVIGRICKNKAIDLPGISLSFLPPQHPGLPYRPPISQGQLPGGNLISHGQILNPNYSEDAWSSYPQYTNSVSSQPWQPNPGHNSPCSPPSYPQAWHEQSGDLALVPPAYPNSSPSNHLYSGNHHHPGTYSHPHDVPHYKPSRGVNHPPSYAPVPTSLSQSEPFPIPTNAPSPPTIYTREHDVPTHSKLYAHETSMTSEDENYSSTQETRELRPRSVSGKKRHTSAGPWYPMKRHPKAVNELAEHAIIPAKPMMSNLNQTTHPHYLMGNN